MRAPARRRAAHVTEELPEAVVRPPLLPGQSNGTVRMVGPQSTRDHEANVDGDLRGEVEADLLQVDEHLSNAFRMEPGSSGGPVWRPDSGEVVGMLVAGGRGRGPRDVYAVAADVLVRARAKPGLPRPPEPAPDQPPIRPVTRRRAAGAERPPRRAPSTSYDLPALLADIDDRAREGSGADSVKVFTIGFSESIEADDFQVLQQISAATRAQAYDASDPASLERIFLDVVNNF